MATTVFFDGTWGFDIGMDYEIYTFRTFDGKHLWIKSFTNGIATAIPPAGCSITSFAELIDGCFEEGSNFTSELLKAFGYDAETAFTGIQFNFNDILVLVTKENATKDRIIAEWNNGVAVMQSPRNKVEQEVFTIDNSTELEFNDEESKVNWEKFVESNSKDIFGFGAMTYARRWAKYMQYLMKKDNKTVFQIAEKASQASDIDGITGFMYGYAVSVLSQCWKHGKELSRWHNNVWKHNDTDEIVTPA